MLITNNIYLFLGGNETKLASVTNQNPEQQARDHIDQQLLKASGWIIPG